MCHPSRHGHYTVEYMGSEHRRKVVKPWFLNGVTQKSVQSVEIHYKPGYGSYFHYRERGSIRSVSIAGLVICNVHCIHSPLSLRWPFVHFYTQYMKVQGDIVCWGPLRTTKHYIKCMRRQKERRKVTTGKFFRAQAKTGLSWSSANKTSSNSLICLARELVFLFMEVPYLWLTCVFADLRVQTI